MANGPLASKRKRANAPPSEGRRRCTPATQVHARDLVQPRVGVPRCPLSRTWKGYQKNRKKQRAGRLFLVFTWDCVFFAYFVKFCCASF
jgi:hypothetical protein